MSEYDKMNPVAKELWLSALRSGEFMQGVGSLLNNDRHCCLGVLSEVAIRSGVEVMKGACNVSDCGCNRVTFDDHTSYHPASVGNWAGLSPSSEAANTLAFKNDVGVTFAEIADWIEENL